MCLFLVVGCLGFCGIYCFGGVWSWLFSMVFMKYWISRVMPVASAVIFLPFSVKLQTLPALFLTHFIQASLSIVANLE